MKVNIFSDEWCDLVFEEKNKEYGAYKLRKLENKRILLATILASALFVAAFSFPMILRAFTPAEKLKASDVITLTNVTFDEPAKKINVPEIPENKPDQMEKIRKQIKFDTPQITDDGDANEGMHSQVDLSSNPAAIGATEVPQGNLDPNAPLNRNEHLNIEKPDENKIHNLVDIQKYPQFPGGEDEMLKFIARHIHYPKMAKETSIMGKVFIQFVVGNDGNITDVKLLRGIGGGCDEEALRVVALMPQWSPGLQNGHPVSVYYRLPVNFSLR
jgi:periplasmic protein TonB